MKRKIYILLAAAGCLSLLWGRAAQAFSGSTAFTAEAQRSDILRAANYEGFGAWWQNRVSGLVDTGTMMYYETADGLPAYCLSNKKGHPNQMTYVLSDETGMEESFGKEEKEAILRILRAGYPLSRDYWRQKGLTDLDMRGATQIALWYVQAQFGVDGHTGGSWKNGSWGNLGQRDVKAMIDALVQYGLSGGKSPVVRSLSLSPGETVIENGEMVCSFAGTVTGYERWTARFDGLPEQTSAEINGKAVTLEGSEIAGTEEGSISIVLRCPCRYGKTISCTITAYGTDAGEALLYYRPLEQTAQDMVVFRMDAYEAKTVSAFLTTPGQTAGKIRLTKTDADTGAVITEGKATYGIYGDRQAPEPLSVLDVEQGTGLSEALPFGTYYVKELSAPFGYVCSDTVTEVVLKEDDSFREFSITELSLSDQKQKGRIQIRKVDGDTGQWISGPAVFEIADQQTGQLMERLTTGADGTALSEPLPLGRVYLVTEVSAPAGYILPEKPAEEAALLGTEDGRAEVLYSCLVENRMQTGSLLVEKRGDGIAGFRQQENGVQILYEEIPLEGIGYTVWAAEDIQAPDGAGTLLAREGEVIGSFVTDEEGRGGLAGLWPGRYILRETEGKDGFLREREAVEFEIKRGEPGEALAGEEEIMIKNKRQMAQISLEKRDASSQKGLPGAVYGLYTGEELTAENGAVLPKDTLLQTVVTGADGRAVFSGSVPGGFRYYVKEIKAPEGFLLSEEKEALLIPSGQERLSPVKAVVYDMPEEDPPGLQLPPVNTGDSGKPLLFVLTACAAVSAAFLLGSLRKKI